MVFSLLLMLTLQRVPEKHISWFETLSQKPSTPAVHEKSALAVEGIDDFDFPVKILKRSMYSFEDILDSDDLEALRDRFERCDEIDACNAFTDKMCAYDFRLSNARHAA